MNLERFVHLSVNWCFSASIGSFQGLPAELSEVILLSQRLALTYSTIPQLLLQVFFTFFSPFFALCELSPVFHREPPGVLTSPAAAGSPPYIITLYRQREARTGIDGSLYYPPESVLRCQDFPRKILSRKISMIFGDCYKTQNIVVFCLTCH